MQVQRLQPTEFTSTIFTALNFLGKQWLPRQSVQDLCIYSCISVANFFFIFFF